MPVHYTPTVLPASWQGRLAEGSASKIQWCRGWKASRWPANSPGLLTAHFSYAEGMPDMCWVDSEKEMVPERQTEGKGRGEEEGNSAICLSEGAFQVHLGNRCVVFLSFCWILHGLQSWNEAFSICCLGSRLLKRKLIEKPINSEGWCMLAMSSSFQLSKCHVCMSSFFAHRTVNVETHWCSRMPLPPLYLQLLCPPHLHSRQRTR